MICIKVIIQFFYAKFIFKFSLITLFIISISISFCFYNSFILDFSILFILTNRFSNDLFTNLPYVHHSFYICKILYSILLISLLCHSLLTSTSIVYKFYSSELLSIFVAILTLYLYYLYHIHIVSIYL